MVGRCARLPRHGEVAEWSKAHAWKVCIRQRIEGSNPSFSANNKKGLTESLFLATPVVSINPNNELSLRRCFPYPNDLKRDNRNYE